MNEVSIQDAEDGAHRGRGHVLLGAAVASFPLALVFPGGIVFALAVAGVSVWLMPRRPSARRWYVAALSISLAAAGLSAIVGIADSSVGT